MEDISKLFGYNLLRLRLKNGLTQEELAARAGFKRSYISKVELGEGNICIKNIDRIAKALGVAPNELFRAETLEGSESR